ncbi:MAG: transcription termination factor Rho [Phycisphaerales bacterium]|nr:transcription termination factor Rho [Phycisphaerales bacterium]
MTQVTGILEWPDRAEGRVRQLVDTYTQLSSDPYVPIALGEQYPLRPGLEVTVEVAMKKSRKRRPGKPRTARPVVDQILSIEGMDPVRFADRPAFVDLISVDPEPKLTLEYPGCPPSCRLIDLFCPLGRGQRALIVSPPKAGKTILLQQIATALATNNPDLEIIALLIDERPEEVTDFRRNVPVKVLASSNDHANDKHVELCVIAMERAKRMVEAGKHVVMVLDSLTRVGRAFNQSVKHANSGRTLSGGVDASALSIPKQLFGVARNTENGGSLTMIATCLVDTGSRADQVIFEEFKGTGNMELILDRSISEKRLYPAMNLAASGTRKEHLLLTEAEMKTMTALRRRLMAMPPPQQIEQLLAALQRFPTNAELTGG